MVSGGLFSPSPSPGQMAINILQTFRLIFTLVIAWEMKEICGKQSVDVLFSNKFGSYSCLSPAID